MPPYPFTRKPAQALVFPWAFPPPRNLAVPQADMSLCPQPFEDPDKSEPMTFIWPARCHWGLTDCEYRFTKTCLEPSGTASIGVHMRAFSLSDTLVALDETTSAHKQTQPQADRQGAVRPRFLFCTLFLTLKNTSTKMRS